MRVEIITNPEQLPDIASDNIFKSRQWFELFSGEQSTCVVAFVVYDGSKLVMLQSVMIQDFIKFLPRCLGSYCVVWGEPFCIEDIAEADVKQAFELLILAIEKYAKRKVLFVEYRHFSDENIYMCNFAAHKYKAIKWGNIIQNIAPQSDVISLFNQSKRRQVRKALSNGVELSTTPTSDEWRDYYLILKQLYKKINRPLPSFSVFERLRSSSIGVCCVVKNSGKVIAGISMLYDAECGGYEWYISGMNREYPHLYPSTMALYVALKHIADNGGGRFNYMGAGQLDKPYSVRDHKLTFGGDLATEYRYRKYLLI
ncbi:MAG: hypothetical protein R3Y59_03605 [bacterium]